MQTLSIVQAPAPEKHPDLDMTGMVAITARVTPKKGNEFYVCNPIEELIEANESNESFVAHTVIAMKPMRVIINPGTIARIEEV